MVVGARDNDRGDAVQSLDFVGHEILQVVGDIEIIEEVAADYEQIRPLLKGEIDDSGKSGLKTGPQSIAGELKSTESSAQMDIGGMNYLHIFTW